MRVDVLQRRLVRDGLAIERQIHDVFPATLPPSYRAKPVNLQSFLNRLNRRTQEFSVVNLLFPDAEMAPGELFQSGEWNYKSELPKDGSMADVRIFWHVHPSSHRIQFTPSQWYYRRFRFWTMLQHELIHRYQDTLRTARGGTQAATRIFKTSPNMPGARRDEQLYLCDFDEVEAYAHNTAWEFLTWFPHLSYKDAVTASMTCTEDVKPTWNMYMECFGGDRQHPALRHYKRKVKAWYSTMLEYPQLQIALNLSAMTL